MLRKNMTGDTRRHAQIKDRPAMPVLLVSVLLGGALGAWLRASLPALPFSLAGANLLPNAIACLVIGALHARRHRMPTLAATLTITGFCGGLSTFSGFAADIASMLSAGNLLHAVLSVILEVGVGIALVVVGSGLSNRLSNASGRA